MPRPLHWLFGIVLVLGVLLLAFVALFQWSWVADYLEQRISAQTGREVEIGRLEGELGWTTRLTAYDSWFANASWAPDQPMLRVPKLEASVPLWSLIAGPTMIRELVLYDPVLRLRVSPQGKPNWAGLRPKGNGKRQLKLRELGVEAGEIHYRNTARGGSGALTLGRLEAHLGGEGVQVRSRNLAGAYWNPSAGQRIKLQLETARVHPGVEDQALQLAGEGTLNGSHLDLDGRLVRPQQQGGAYVFQLAANWGRTQLVVDGGTGKAPGLDGLYSEVRLRGADTGRLSPLLPVQVPALGNYRLHGQLSRQGTLWRLSSMQLELGQTRVDGWLALQRAGPKPLVEGKLHSQRLELGRWLDALAPGRDTTSGQLIPATNLPVDVLTRFNADLSLTGDVVTVAGMRWKDLRMDLRLQDGALTVAPLRFDLLDGSTRFALQVRADQQPVHSRLEANVSNVDLQNVLQQLGVNVRGFGNMDAYLRLNGTGRSAAAFAASADGSATLVMRDGSLTDVLTELASGDVGEALMAMGGEDKTVPLRCAVGDFQVRSGTMRVESLVVDSAGTKFVGHGKISLGQENVDIHLQPRHKDFSLLSGQAPIHISGNWNQLQVQPAAGQLAFSFITPVELGLGEDAQCQQIIRHALQDIGGFGLATRGREERRG